MTADGLPDKEEDRRFFRLIEERETVEGWITLQLGCGHDSAYRVLPESWRYAPCYICLTAWEQEHRQRNIMRQWQAERRALACANTPYIKETADGNAS